jgi:ABC-2 type transport system ATP-binding protein
MIAARNLMKRYGERVAVDDLSFVVEPGVVTGFLGPNGAGKSTTMRLILGLDMPTSGAVTVNGRPYRDHPAPLTEVGALLEARAIHTGRTAYDHLLSLADTHGIGRPRIDELLDLVGLTGVAHKRVKSFSLGMGQRLGIASALLGDPQTLILDEPVNGLDPEGIHWIRTLLKRLAAEGRTIFVSSHLMSEMSQTAERVIVIGRGRIIADTTMEEFIRSASSGRVRVRTPDTDRLALLLRDESLEAIADDAGVLEVRGTTSERVGALAASAGIVLHELTPIEASLEEAFMTMTSDSVEFHTADREVAAI